MSDFTTELSRILFTNPNSIPAFEEVCKELFRQKLEDAINEIMKEELSAVLDYELYERNDSDNCRNGYYKREYLSNYGTLHLNIPRDRLNEFRTKLLDKYQRRSGGIDEKIIRMYQLGMSNSEMQEMAEDLFGKHYSSSTVSNITSRLIENIDIFKKRPLKEEYAVVYLDATYLALRRDSVAKEAVHIALGVTAEGKKEILAYSIAPEESVGIWKEVLLDLKQRGIRRVSLFCSDGLHGMPEAISETFSSSRIQRCLLHVSRNISKKVRAKDRKEILDDFKAVYTRSDKQAALDEMKVFKEKWKKYPKVIESLENNQYLFTYYDYPVSVRKSIYVTNLLESYNKKLKRSFKKKEQFPNETSMEKYLINEFTRYNNGAGTCSLKGFQDTIYADWFSDN